MHKRTLFIFILAFFSILLTSFISGKKEITIKLKPVFGNRNLSLGNEKYLTSEGDTVYIDLLRFYISNLQIEFDNGNIYKEKNSFHLVEINNEQAFEFILKNVPDRLMKKISFSIGVDSLTCVSGALGGDLDPSKGMYWAWNSGYINAKMEGRSNSCSTRHHAFEFHIGGYLPPYQSIQKISLSVNNSSGELIITTDVAAWFKGIKLTEKNSILIPGNEAVKMSQNYKAMFKIEPAQ